MPHPVYWSINFCYFVCLSPVGHNSKPIFMKLYHMVVCYKLEAYCFWGQKVNVGQRSTTKVVFLKSSIFITLTWNLKRIYISGHWIKPANYFWGQHRPKGQHKANFEENFFSSDWHEIWRGFGYLVIEFNHQLFFW